MINFYLLLIVAQFAIAISYILANGGLLKHLYFAFSLLLYSVWILFAGFAIYDQKNFYDGLISIEDVYEQGMMVYTAGLFCFIIGYIIKGNAIRPTPFVKGSPYFNDKLLLRITLFFLVLNYIFRFAGVRPDGTLGRYLLLSQDFLIILTIGCFLRRIKVIYFYPILFSAIFLFSANFFRYRIYLTVLGVGVVYLQRNPEFIRKIGRYIILGFVFVYCFLFFTVNRLTLANMDLGNLEFNVLNTENGLETTLLKQGSNLYTDFAVIKYFRNRFEEGHDHGLTMGVYPFIRAVPASIFPGGVKPYPPPSLKTIIDAYGGGTDAENAGRAVTNIGEFYIAFGLGGVFVGMFLFGYVLKLLQNRWKWDGTYNSMISLAILVSIFQYITRGYFPQYVNHILYLLIPILLVRKFSGRHPFLKRGQVRQTGKKIIT